jgi:hypothetical protein
MRAEDVPAALDSVNAAGLQIDRDDRNGKARLAYGKRRALLRWVLPSPLFGGYDDSWFAQARRTRFLGLRIRVAPIEELLWLRMVVPSGASLADPLVGQILLAHGAELDWDRLRSRMAGQEALLLAHIFLFWHQYPESARRVVPDALIDGLRANIDQPEDAWRDADDEETTEEAGNVEDLLAAESLHRGP